MPARVAGPHRPPKSYFFRVAQRVRCLATRAGCRCCRSAKCDRLCRLPASGRRRPPCVTHPRCAPPRSKRLSPRGVAAPPSLTSHEPSCFCVRWVSALRLRPGCSAAPQMSSGEPTAAGHWLLNLLQRRGAAHTFCSCRADVITAADSHRPRRHRPRPRRRRPRRRRHRSITSCSFRWMPQRCGHRARDASQ